jgi:hypothetical protein
LLVKNARIAGKDNYPETVRAAFGKPGHIFVIVTLLAYTFGSKCPTKAVHGAHTI